MDFLIKLGENGMAFPFSNVPNSEKVIFLQEKIKNETKIEIKDQILLTKKGYKLKAEDVLSVVENDNIFQTTLHSDLSNRLKQTNIIYVFSEKIINSSSSSQELSNREQNKENLIKEFLENNEENSENLLISAKIIEKDFPKSFKTDFPLFTDQEKLISLNPDIFSIEELLFKQYQTIKKKYLEYSQRLKKLDKGINECENQMQSFDVILKETSQCYQVVKIKKNDIQKRMKENQEKNTFTVKKFEESIENLKKIELHEELKNEKVNFLLDVYYDPEAMVQWKNNCLTTQTNLKLKSDKIAGYLKNMKKKIKDERNSNIASGINLYKTQKNSFDTFFHETETIMLSFFTEIYDEYKNLRKNMEVFNNKSENENALFFLSNLENMSKKINHYNDQILICNDNNEKLIKLYENIMKTKGNLEHLIIQEYRIMHKFIFELTTFNNEKIKLLNEEVDKMEKEFSYLLSPLSLPNAYQASLAEISRRREFFQVFERKSSKMNKMIETEKEKRKKFLSNFGKILPSEFIPQLKSMPPIIAISNLLDGALPKIDGYHSEQESYLKKKKQDKNKPLEKENIELKQEILILREKLEKDKNNKSIEKSDTDYTISLKDLDEINKKIASLNTNNKEILNNDQESTKLKLKIQNLTELLQQTSKFTHYLFLSKLRDKQQEIDTIKNSYENQLMRAEDLIVLEKNTLILEYEDQINILNLNMNEMEVKLTESQRNNDGEKLKKELKNKTDLLKLNEEKIRSLNDIRSSLNKEVQEQKEKILNYEKKIKIEHTEVLSKIHDLHKTETDKYKARIKNLEADFFNKSSELEKLNRQISEILKENRNKTEEIDKKTNESNILLQSNLKLKEDIQKLTNRLENLDIMISNRTSEIQNITKLNKELNFEKNSLNSENQHIRMQLVEFQNKGQKAIEALRIIELEKENLKSKNNKAKGEIEKKQIEINNLIKQIDLLNNQQKSLDRVCESQQQEKEKLNQLNDELTKKQVELNIYETKVEIFEADLDNKSQELEFLQNDLTSAKEEKEELRKEIEGLESQLNEERMSYNLLNQNLNDFKMINEHFQAEQEILEQKNQEIEICSKALQLKYNELIAKVANYDELTTKLSKNELELKEMSKKQIDLKEEKEKFERKIEETLFILCQKEGEIQKISSENDQQCIKIKDLYIEKENISKELNEKFIMLQNQENKNQDLFNELTLQENLYKEEIQSLTKEMNELRSSFDNIMKEITYLKEENHKLLEQSHNKSDIFDKEDKYVKGNEKEEKFATEQKEKMIDLERDNSYFEKQFETTKQGESIKDIVQGLDSNSVFYIKQNSTTKNILKEIKANEFLKFYANNLETIEYSGLSIGMKYIFIPVTQGIYSPLILRQINSSFSINDTHDDLNIKSYKNNFFLDIETIESKYKELIMECSLIIIAKVKDVKEIVTSKPDNMFNLKTNEIYSSIFIESPEYIIGFEGDDFALKNFAV